MKVRGRTHSSVCPSFRLFSSSGSGMLFSYNKRPVHPSDCCYSFFVSYGLPAGSRWLRDFTVVAGAVLRRALRWTDGLGAFQAVAFGAAGRVGQRVRASVHHDGVHAVGHGEGLEVGLDGDGQRQLVDEVDRRARHDGSAAEVLQAEHCREDGGQSVRTVWFLVIEYSTPQHSLHTRLLLQITMIFFIDQPADLI